MMIMVMVNIMVVAQKWVIEEVIVVMKMMRVA